MVAEGNNLAVVIATKDNRRTIEECLESVAGLHDRLLIVDSGSTDGTIEICESKGAEIIHRDWPGMVKQRQFCIDACSDYRWILVLDSDESLDGELFAEVKRVVAEDRPEFDAYAFNRKVWFMDGWLHHVFQPELRLRLVRGGVAKVEGVGPEGKGGHDRIEVPGKTGRIAGTCKHDSWTDAGEMMSRYVELGKRAALYDSRPGGEMRLFLSPTSAFIKQYVLKRGFRDGRRGLIASAGAACGSLIKQLLKLALPCEVATTRKEPSASALPVNKGEKNPGQNNLAVVIPTKNNMRTIGECLDSVAGLYDRLLIVDSGSTDGTIDFCRGRGGEVIHNDWKGSVNQKQFCLDACKDYRWVLNLDSDESLDKELYAEVARVVEEADPAYDGYVFNRKVWFMGGWLHHVFQPELRLRLVRGGVGTILGIGPEGKGGHDRIEVPGKTGRIAGTCKHDSWKDAGEMMARYVDLGRRAARYDTKPGSVRRLFGNPVGAFFKQYFLKGGIRDGRRGLVACAGVAGGNLIKQILKLASRS